MSTDTVVAEALPHTIDSALDERLTELRRHFDADIEAAKQTHAAVTLLAEAGIETEYDYPDSVRYVRIEVGEHDLPIVRRVLGPWQAKDPEAHMWKKNTVNIQLVLERFPAVKLLFSKLLPADSKCKVIQEPYTCQALVCEQ